MPAPVRIAWVAFERFAAHDGWAIASHIALSALMSLFPFLIFVTSLAGALGSLDLANEVAGLLLEAWPAEIAVPIAGEIRNVMSATRGDVLTFGAGLALYFASSGVESLRIGLNRAYEAYDWRAWWHTRLESIVYVILGAAGMLVVSVTVVFGPILWRTLLVWAPWLAPFGGTVAVLRLGLASVVIVAALVVAHLVLAAGRRSFRQALPGLLVTLIAWLAGSVGFGMYLESFSNNYVTTYAGLATAMVALVFLYALSAIFLYGAELNAAIDVERRR